MTSRLRTLALAILSGVDAIEAIYSKAGIPVPSLHEPSVPPPLDGDHNALLDAQHLVTNSAAQLIAQVSNPIDLIEEKAMGMYTTALLGFVIEANIPEILKTAGPKGLAAKEIAASAGVDAAKLARVLRYLAARHTFTEVSPNVFANNRLSSVLIISKSLDEIKSNPQSKWENPGISSLIAHIADEGLKSAPFISSFLLDPKKESGAPFNMAIGSPSTLWEWYAKPENVHRGIRFSSGMKACGARYTAEDITTRIALDWAALEADSVVVDIGGGAGNITLQLAKSFPHLKYIIQDLNSVITGTAEKFWAEECPDLISNGSVTLQAHDFFLEQPVKSAAVYHIRHVLHDWDDEKCIQILERIREAAGPSSTLVVGENSVPSACYSMDTNSQAGSLLLITSVDIHMMSLLDGKERSFSDLIELGKAAGWKCGENEAAQRSTTLVFSPA